MKNNTLTTTKVSFNTLPFILGPKFRQPTLADFPKLSFKNASWDAVYESTTDYVRAVLDSISGVKYSGLRDRVVVDQKVHDLEVGKTPCLPGWHCDTVVNPLQTTRGEIHDLFVTGYSSLTEFIDETVMLDVNPELQHQVLLEDLRQQLSTMTFKTKQIPSCQWVNYGRKDFHRSVPAKVAEKRLLLRVTSTDIIRPHNQPIELKNYG